MACIVTLPARGTDLVLAALKSGGKNLHLSDLYCAFAERRINQGLILPRTFRASVRNELQRLNSDSDTYHKEQRQLDLFVQTGKAKYSLRDAAYAKLLTAANEIIRPQDPIQLIAPLLDGPTYSGSSYNHIVGEYAQSRIMNEMGLRGYTVFEDTRNIRAYDFAFLDKSRRGGPQIMECKGTQKSSIETVSLTDNEVYVLMSNSSNYWLGVVCGIEVRDNVAQGGSRPYITSPPVMDNWCFRNPRLMLRDQQAFALSQGEENA